MNKREFNPVPVFRARTDRERLILSDQVFAGTMGSVLDKGRTVEVNIASINSAFHRTVRLHEADHLKYSPKRLKATDKSISWKVVQACEDGRISQLPVWRWRPASVRRDALATALKESRVILRRVLRAKANGMASPDLYNSACCELVRDISLTVANDTKGRHTCALLGRIEKVGLPANGLYQVASYCRVYSYRKRKRPQQALQSLLMHVDPPEGNETSGEDGGKPEQPDTSGPHAPMTIVTLPLTEPCDRLGETEDLSAGQSGYRINGRSLVQTHLGIASEPFIRRSTVLAQGGACLIDASGSMSFSRSQLLGLCQAAPAMSVAYYHGARDHSEGWLRIFAKDGYRAKVIPSRNGHGENVVDLPAVQWLLAQPGPRFLVSDLDFYSRNASDTQYAKQLVKFAQFTGDLTIVGNVSEALEAFKKA